MVALDYPCSERDDDDDDETHILHLKVETFITTIQAWIPFAEVISYLLKRS